MKAILVIDQMPKSCEECKYRGHTWLSQDIACILLDSKLPEDNLDDVRSVMCPLIPLPEEKWENVTDHDEHVYANGFNDCLHIITGEGWTCKLGG